MLPSYSSLIGAPIGGSPVVATAAQGTAAVAASAVALSLAYMCRVSGAVRARNRVAEQSPVVGRQLVAIQRQVLQIAEPTAR